MRENINRQHQMEKAHSISPVGYWKMDLSSQFIWISDEAISIFGFEKDCHTIQLYRFQSIPLPEYRTMLEEILDNLLLYNEPYEAEFIIKREDDGTIRSVYSKAWLQRLPNEEQVMVSGLIQDVTDKVLEEEEVNNVNSILINQVLKEQGRQSRNQLRKKISIR